MFSKLKEKLKSALSIFSKKAEEEAEVKEEKDLAEEYEDVFKETEAAKEEAKEEKEEPIPSAKELIQQTKKQFSKKEQQKRREEKERKKTEPPFAEKLVEEVEEEPEEEAEKDLADEYEDVFKETEAAKEEAEEKKEEVKPKKSLFGRIKEKLTTKTISADKFENLFWELEVILLENNVSLEVVEKIKEDLKEELVDKPLPRDVNKKIEGTLRNSLKEILTFGKVDLLEKAKEHKPLVIAFFGINGTGKTTTIAKLTKYFQNNNKSVALAAGDTFRAAAIDQLQEHADKLNVKLIKHDYGSDAAAVAFDAVKYAEKNNIDVVMIDTAGRLHSNTNLMAELEKIIRVTKPHLNIFVGESITGNDCIEQAKQFNELVEIDGAILTKADVDEKGGAPLSIAYAIKKPIMFLGVGQKYEDLEEFNREVVLGRLGF